MTKFSTDAAGFAALTISELMLQQCVLSGLFTAEEARRLLSSAARRHEAAAEGPEEKIALNMEAAHLIRALGSGLEPLFRERRDSSKTVAPRKPAPKSRPNWVRFPD
ncbi:hypothetical protein J0X12_07995 [Sneathiella sp. CAU 1612]|uniref:Uncharacterized protein n=1 Tax=Sneathiella sedimenti TaxID=2816034 RepID=A0ABS3F574_9PROT|nr:hypothetical protein [Sneathiella sedimenti]MBO0333549.1 hypothetical protein [Sneathiella sedimenti]